MHAEGEGAAVAEQARHLRDGPIGIREDHGTVVAEDGVERGIGERH